MTPSRTTASLRGLMRKRPSALLCSLLLAVACNSDPKGDLYAYHVVFVGTVKDTAGAPIGGAVLAFQHDTLDACTGTGHEMQNGSTETDGTYRLDFTIVTSIGGCV